MRRNFLTAVLLAVAVLATACSTDQSTAPPDPLEPPQFNYTHLPAACNAPRAVVLITVLYPPNKTRIEAYANFGLELLYMSQGRTTQAATTMFELVQTTLTNFRANKLLDPTRFIHLNTAQAVGELVTQLYNCAGKADQAPPNLGGTLGSGAGAGMVFPSSNTTQVVSTPDGRAAASFPPGSVNEPVLVTVTPDPLGTNPFPHTFTEYEPFFDFSTFPHVERFGALVTVGICVNDPDIPPGVFARLQLAHPDPDNREILELLPRVAPPPQVVCARRFGFETPRAPGLMPMLGFVARQALGLFAPEALQAAVVVVEEGGLGGTTDSFTDFRAVDPESGQPRIEGFSTPTGDMDSPRRDQRSVLLGDGKVLIVGGTASGAELYDPAEGTFTSLETAWEHGQGATATKLADGRVLVVGGNNAPRLAEIYDPEGGYFFGLEGSTRAPHSYHSATLLDDGRVLLAGGYQNTEGPQASGAQAEIFDPSEDFFALVGDLNNDRAAHAATLLPNGKVLIVGGQHIAPEEFSCLSSAELFDPATDEFSLTGSMAGGRCSMHLLGITLLDNGLVLVAGEGSKTAELYSPANGEFSATGTAYVAHNSGTATLLGDGRVLLAGGYTAGGPVTTDAVEIYDPATGTFTQAASMTEKRQEHGAILLEDGRVLLTGGAAGLEDLSSAELYSLEPPIP